MTVFRIGVNGQPDGINYGGNYEVSPLTTVLAHESMRSDISYFAVTTPFTLMLIQIPGSTKASTRAGFRMMIVSISSSEKPRSPIRGTIFVKM